MHCNITQQWFTVLLLPPSPPKKTHKTMLARPILHFGGLMKNRFSTIFQHVKSLLAFLMPSSLLWLSTAGSVSFQRSCIQTFQGMSTWREAVSRFDQVSHLSQELCPDFPRVRLFVETFSSQTSRFRCALIFPDMSTFRAAISMLLLVCQLLMNCIQNFPGTVGQLLEQPYPQFLRLDNFQRSCTLPFPGMYSSLQSSCIHTFPSASAFTGTVSRLSHCCKY